MKRFPYLALFVLVLAALACAVPRASPEATATPLPTDTPEPTATPTDTPTPVPTPTLNLTGTAEALATQASEDVLGELDTLLGNADIPYKEGHLAWKQNKSIVINMSGPDDDFTALDKNLTAGNFILKSDVTWEASGLLIKSLNRFYAGWNTLRNPTRNAQPA